MKKQGSSGIQTDPKSPGTGEMSVTIFLSSFSKLRHLCSALSRSMTPAAHSASWGRIYEGHLSGQECLKSKAGECKC